MRILYIEDDELLGESVKASAAMEGYALDWLRDGSLAMAALKAGTYDLIILDRRLPGLTGVDILKSIRREGLETPVLFLTACDSLEEKITGLDAGADDYMTKPFELDELFARVRSLLRRTTSKAPVLTAGDLILNPATREVSFAGEVVNDLTVKEYSVLEMLMRNRGRFVTKERLLEGSNSWDEEVESNTVEVYISRLRKRFGHGLIETLRGVGYRIR
ncbi:MAG TPA: response regulator transcription factor [Porticoccaceae bacterium]